MNMKMTAKKDTDLLEQTSGRRRLDTVNGIDNDYISKFSPL